MRTEHFYQWKEKYQDFILILILISDWIMYINSCKLNTECIVAVLDVPLVIEVRVTGTVY